ncbi:nucleotide exchange factor GrpE [Haloimpatiens lingqiaonensis]|uniref:nucleotide exchange factor GrpE n=1 Tax=Haloimpatiens lingqiaonensis TaxID=1380675 RepID=UPI0010FE7797|nr:nucleotide exchange factor GrpE [Haloimpatiens lingqiaonensis]
MTIEEKNLNEEQEKGETLENKVKEEAERCDNEDVKTSQKESEEKDEKETFLKELQEQKEKLESEIRNIKDDNTKLNNENNALKDRLERVVSEYDNYRNRTTKEKEAIYDDACEDVLKHMFPVLDNLERAMCVEGCVDDIKKGIEMTIKQFKDSFEKIGVEEISIEEGFDPNFHNAVMHVEDDNYKENSVVEVFQKGYKKGNKVLRYSMVKVAN